MGPDAGLLGIPASSQKKKGAVMLRSASTNLREYVGRASLLIDRIISINVSLRSTRNPSFFLESLVKAAMDFTTAGRGGFIRMKNGDRPTIVASQNLNRLKPVQSALIGLAVARAAREGKELLSPGLKTRGRLSDRALADAGINSLVCMPAKIDDEVFGFLYLDNCLDSRFLADNLLAHVRLLCNQIAVGLSNVGIGDEGARENKGLEHGDLLFTAPTGTDHARDMIISRSRVMTTIMNQVRQVAPTDSTVLIIGETGVGKELVAKAIHNLSDRRKGPFVPTNLAALPRELVTSELFGYEKGAFTGAGERHQGRFEIAHGGSIFLDEIGDLPPEVQIKLLRVLQEGSFERLGNGKPIRSDFRVIAATHRNLGKEVEKGIFRRDLFYRLNVFPIYIPPLRDRKEDIPPLTRHFINVFCRKMHKKDSWISAGELRKLMGYQWPGNIRELEHVIERAVITMDGHGITFPDLNRAPAGLDDEDSGAVLLADVEREHIRRVLTDTGWRVGGRGGAAAILGLKPTTLFFRMKKLGIAKPPSMRLPKRARVAENRAERETRDRCLALPSR